MVFDDIINSVSYPYLSQESRIIAIIKGLKWPIFRNIQAVIVQLPNDDSVEEFHFVTKIQKIDTTRSHGIEIEKWHLIEQYLRK